jgi:hypothetical protein
MRYVGAALAATLLLAGCTEAEGEPEAAATSSGSPTVSESPTETPTEPPPPEPVDPCSLLTAEDLEAAGLSADPDEAIHGLAPDPRTTACLVPQRKDGWAIFYGYSLKPGVSVDDAVETVGTEKPVRLDVGDQARLVLYHSYGDKTWHAWASEGEYSVMVQLFEKPRSAQVERLLGRMLEQVDPAMFEFPIDLPAGCPNARSRPLQNLLGTVTTATGSNIDGEVRCDYADRRGRMVNLNLDAYQSPEKVASTVRQVEQYFDEPPTTPARGVTLYISTSEGYAFSAGYVTRPPTGRGSNLQQIPLIGAPFTTLLKYDEQKYRALAAWWATRS